MCAVVFFFRLEHSRLRQRSSGDRANRLALDVYEAVLADQVDGGKDRRFRIEHSQILNCRCVVRRVVHELDCFFLDSYGRTSITQHAGNTHTHQLFRALFGHASPSKFPRTHTHPFIPFFLFIFKIATAMFRFNSNKNKMSKRRGSICGSRRARFHAADARDGGHGFCIRSPWGRPPGVLLRPKHNHAGLRCFGCCCFDPQHSLWLGLSRRAAGPALRPLLCGDPPILLPRFGVSNIPKCFFSFRFSKKSLLLTLVLVSQSCHPSYAIITTANF